MRRVLAVPWFLVSGTSRPIASGGEDAEAARTLHRSIVQSLLDAARGSSPILRGGRRWRSRRLLPRGNEGIDALAWIAEIQ
jgi:hypothetical protein